MNQYRCETCNFCLSLIDCVDTCKGEGLTNGEWEAYRKRGCASHSDFQSERDKVLDKLCKICPFLDERPETCENCVVETVRKELRQAGSP